MPTVHGVTIVGITLDKTMTIAAVGNLTIHETPVGSTPIPPDMPPPVVDNSLPTIPPSGPPDHNVPIPGTPTPHKK